LASPNFWSGYATAQSGRSRNSNFGPQSTYCGPLALLTSQISIIIGRTTVTYVTNIYQLARTITNMLTFANVRDLLRMRTGPTWGSVAPGQVEKRRAPSHGLKQSQAFQDGIIS